MGWPDPSSPPRWTGRETGRRETASTPVTKPRCRSVFGEIWPVAGDEPAHIVHRLDGTLLVDGLNRHHRNVLVVGQVDASPPRAGRKRQPDDTRPRNQPVAEQVSHLDAGGADAQPRPCEQQYRAGDDGTEQRDRHLVSGLEDDAG